MSRKIHEGINGREELDRVLRSRLFRNSESLRRLLRYLAEKSLVGEADELKEFTIGVEALGKPEDYNPQLDPSVRVQVGRLRKKLDEYYRDEGKSDALRIALPKRHFKIVFEERLLPDTVSPLPPVDDVARTKLWQGVGVGALLATLIFVAIVIPLARPGANPAAAEPSVALTEEQYSFWRPYAQGDRSTLICMGTPMFVWLDTKPGVFFRDPLLNDWDEGRTNQRLLDLQSALGNPAGRPTHTYTGALEAMGAFQVGKHLTLAGLDPILIRSSDFDWSETRQANVVYIGAPKVIPHLNDEQFQSAFKVVPEGVENAEPRPGEEALYGRERLPNGRPASTHAVIGRFRTKDESGYATVLSSWDGPGIWAAAAYLTRPDSMKTLHRVLTPDGGEYPESFEVILRAEFKQDFPVNLAYVTHRVHER